MANTSIPNAAALSADTIATGDLIPVHDISAETGSKASKITAAELRAYALAGITDPDVAYIADDGDDDAGDGSPGTPFATLQSAFDFGFRNFRIGICDAGNLDCGGGSAVDLSFIGCGYGVSLVGDVLNSGQNLEIADGGMWSIHFNSLSTNGPTDGAAGSIILHNVHSGAVSAIGGSGGDVGSAGGTAGDVFLDGFCWVESINSTGGGGGSGDEIGAGGNGGDGGNITILGPSHVTGNVAATAGPAGNDGGAGAGSDGNAGNITVGGAAMIDGVLDAGGNSPSIQGALISNTWIDN